MVPPLASDFFQVLDAEFNSLAGVNRNFLEVKIISAHVQLWLCQVSDEVNHVGGTILDVDRNHEVSTAKLLLLTRCENNSEQLRSVRHNLNTFVLIERDTSLIKQLLIKVEVDWKLATIGQAERALLRTTNNNIAKVASVSGELNVFEGDRDTIDTHLSLGGSLLILARVKEFLAALRHGLLSRVRLAIVRCGDRLLSEA